MRNGLRVAAAFAVALIFTVPAFAMPVEKVTSPGGITAWLVRDTSVPVISVSFSFAAGAAMDPEGKEGRAEMVASTMDEGAGDLDSQGFQGKLEEISASLRFSAGRERFTGALRTLSARRDEAFGLLRLALTAPRFDEEPVGRIRAQLVSSLQRKAHDPDHIAGRAFIAAAFPDHPYGRPSDGTIESLARIAPDDLREFVKKYLARDVLHIGVVGDITGDELAKRLDRVFGALPAKAEPFTVPEVEPRGAGERIVIERNIPQSVVMFGQKGLRRDDPDWYAAYVMNRILGGGGFSSRLTEEVREKRGLAYSVYSYLNPYERSALIMGGTATQNARVAESLRIIRAEWRRMAEEGVTGEELAQTKTYINGSFPLRLDSSRRIASMLTTIQVEELGIDYIERRPELINKVTAADVRRVAQRLLRDSELLVVVVGKPEGLATGQ
jgi:zinc protease